MVCDTHKGTITVLENKAIKMLVMLSSVTPISWDFRFCRHLAFSGSIQIQVLEDKS